MKNLLFILCVLFPLSLYANSIEGCAESSASGKNEDWMLEVADSDFWEENKGHISDRHTNITIEKNKKILNFKYYHEGEVNSEAREVGIQMLLILKNMKTEMSMETIACATLLIKHALARSDY